MEINRENEIKKTLKKLRAIFKNLEADKKQIVDNLIEDYVFLYVDNLILKEGIKKYGSVYVDKLHGSQKTSEFAKQYQRNSNMMNMHTRTLLLMLRGNDIETEDALDKFLKAYNK